jgi:hypothetical protein
MGFFSRSPREAEHSRRYLQLAPPGPRTLSLSIWCILKILPMPVASKDRYGKIVTVDEIQHASSIVRDVMAQDRDLSAWVARKSVVQLNAMLGGLGNNEDMIEAGLNSNMFRGLQAVGIELDDVGPEGDAALKLIAPDDDPSDPEDHVAARDLATSAMAVLLAALGRTPAHERQEYEDLYIDSTSAETKGYSITAWSSIMSGRLMHIDAIPQFQPLNLPAMWGAGWYPNPPNTGRIVNGNAQSQRYWDGSAWTERLRILQGGRWVEIAHSLHKAPE